MSRDVSDARPRATVSHYRHCEFGHLMSRIHPPHPLPTYFGHVHEDEALHCALLVIMGWPDAGVI